MTFNLKRAYLFPLVGLLLLPISAFSKEDLKNLEGIYARASRSCVDRNGNEKPSCAERVSACLSIKKIGEDTVEIEVFSEQTNVKSICALKGVAKREGNFLNFVGEDETYGKDDEVLQIAISEHYLLLKTKARANDVLPSPFCGVHASLDRIRFKRSEKALQGKCDAAPSK